MSASDIAIRAVEGGAMGAMVGSQILPGWGTAIGAGVGLIAGAIGGYVEGEEKDKVINSQKQASEKSIQNQRVAAQITARNMAQNKARAQTGSGNQLMQLASLERQEANGWEDVRSRGVVFSEQKETRAKSPVAPQFYGNNTSTAVKTA